MKISNPKVSVVIVSYKVKDLLIACLHSIFKFSSNDDIEVIVVDNASNDQTVNAVQSLFPQVTVISNAENKGFPAANNQGFKIAKGEYILMLNPDTELIENSIEKLITYLEGNESVLLVAPKLINSDRSHQYSCWKFPTVWSILLDIVYLNKIFSSHYYKNTGFDFTFEVDSVSGAAMLFRRSTIDKLNGLNEYLFWIEDIDLCYRIKALGGKVVYFSDTTIVHHIGQSAKKNYNISISNQVINKVKFFKVHEKYFQMIVVQLISLLNVILRAFVFFVFSPLNVVYWRKSKAYFYTIPRIFSLP